MPSTMKGPVRQLLLLAALAACFKDEGEPATGNGLSDFIVFDTIATGLENPLFITAPPGDTGRLFILEQPGRIRIVKHGVLLDTPFLDFEDSVSQGGEQGVLGLAFAPDYATSGALYLFTTDLAGDIRLLRFKVSGDPDLADATSGVTVLAFDHPESNHNGGMIAFGNDGYLYIGSGDGGGGGDPLETGQDPSDLLGAILRIDVSGDSAGYVVPATNPFVGDSGFAPEVWIYGLRNPWRFSFDRETHDLWIGDVGQGEWEEIDHLPAGVGGQNLGWDILEGTHCFEPSVGCSSVGTILPLIEYGHGSDRCSVIGGYVIPDFELNNLIDTYVFGDLCDGVIRFAFASNGGKMFDVPTGSSLLTFGEDASGQLYAGLGNGQVIRIRAEPLVD
jgi:hypothetical protein